MDLLATSYPQNHIIMYPCAKHFFKREKVSALATSYFHHKQTLSNRNAHFVSERENESCLVASDWNIKDVALHATGCVGNSLALKNRDDAQRAMSSPEIRLPSGFRDLHQLIQVLEGRRKSVLWTFENSRFLEHALEVLRRRNKFGANEILRHRAIWVSRGEGRVRVYVVEILPANLFDYPQVFRRGYFVHL